MRRPGVSLVEVLVAAVLLAIGIAGTLAALTSALQLRERAIAREHLASLALDKLRSFSHKGCSLPLGILPVDTTLSKDIHQLWTLEQHGDTLRLHGSARRTIAGRNDSVTIDVRRRCK